MSDNPRLEAVYQAIHDDPYWKHLRNPGINLVPGYGQSDPTLCKVMLVGEAPGAVENSRLRPFCGPSGRVLNHLMGLAGLRLDDNPSGDASNASPPYGPANAFVTNVVKYRPPGNRTPGLWDIMHSKGDPMFVRDRIDDPGDGRTAAEVAAAGCLRAEWHALGGPRVIVCVGGVAHQALHPGGHLAGVATYAGAGWEARGADGNIVPGYWVWSQFHPAYGLRKGERAQRMMSKQWEYMGECLRNEGLL